MKIVLLLTLFTEIIQLPLVSVTEVTVWLLEGSSVTFKFPPQWTITQCCRDDLCKCVLGQCVSTDFRLLRVTVTKKAAVNTNWLQVSRNKLQCEDLLNLSQADSCQYLNVTTGLHLSGGMESCLEGVDFSEGQSKKQDRKTAAHCRALCTQDPTCQYFTYHTKNRKCSLVSSSENVVIKLDPCTVSGYPLRNGCRDINASSFLQDDAGLEFHQEAKSWIDALDHCYSQDSSLVQITNPTVQDAVNSLLRNNTDRVQDGVWIGLERSIFASKDPWLWISGTEAKDLSWNSSFPVDELNNHCGKIIRVEESQFKWLDANCHDKLPFICQTDPT